MGVPPPTHTHKPSPSAGMSRGSPEQPYLDRRAVVGSGHAGVSVPAHAHRGVGPGLPLAFQGATGAACILGLLLWRDLLHASWGRRPLSEEIGAGSE